MSVKPLSGLPEPTRPASLPTIEAGPTCAINTAICLCTYRRPEMLRRLLRHLREAYEARGVRFEGKTGVHVEER